MSEQRDLVSLNIAVLTVSDRRTEDNDHSGQLLMDRCTKAGHHLVERQIIVDDVYAIRATVSRWIAQDDLQVVLSTGGTGLTGRDVTPEALLPLFDKPIHGFGELFRALSYTEIDAATIQSRCVAGVANKTYIFSMPGSLNAVTLGWDRIIGPQLDNRTFPCNLVRLLPRLDERR